MTFLDGLLAGMGFTFVIIAIVEWRSNGRLAAVAPTIIAAANFAVAFIHVH